MYANFAADDARQPDVIHTLFFTVARQYADTFTEIYKHTYIHIYKYMFGSNFHGLAPERGLRRAFGPTNLLTSLRSGLRPSLREEITIGYTDTLCGPPMITLASRMTRNEGSIMDFHREKNSYLTFGNRGPF